MITHSELLEACIYDSNSGSLIWKTPGKKRIVGKKVGSVALTGYLETSINYSRQLVHRLVWLYHYGTFPKGALDHINHNRLDNRIENLREVTNSQNNYNQSKRTQKTTSRYRGVSWETRRGSWKAAINKEGTYYYIGNFKSEEIAAKEYNTKAIELYGIYANLNRVE